MLTDLFRADSLLLGVAGEWDPLLLLAVLVGLAGAAFATGVEGIRGAPASTLLLFALSLCGAVVLRQYAVEVADLVPAGGHPGPSVRWVIEDVLRSGWPTYCSFLTLAGLASLRRMERGILDSASAAVILIWGWNASASLRESYDAHTADLLYHALLQSMGASVLSLAGLVVLMSVLRCLLGAGWPGSRQLCWSSVPVGAVLLDYFFSLWVIFPFAVDQLRG